MSKRVFFSSLFLSSLLIRLPLHFRDCFYQSTLISPCQRIDKIAHAPIAKPVSDESKVMKILKRFRCVRSHAESAKKTGKPITKKDVRNASPIIGAMINVTERSIPATILNVGVRADVSPLAIFFVDCVFFYD